MFENHAHILRQKDILAVEDANTPARRAYLALQCAYMFPERRDEHLADFHTLLADLTEAAPSTSPIAEKINALVDDDRLYGALKECRNMIEYEAKILSHVQ